MAAFVAEVCEEGDRTEFDLTLWRQSLAPGIVIGAAGSAFSSASKRRRLFPVLITYWRPAAAPNRRGFFVAVT